MCLLLAPDFWRDLIRVGTQELSIKDQWLIDVSFLATETGVLKHKTEILSNVALKIWIKFQ
jgi:hypothetical protein